MIEKRLLTRKKRVTFLSMGRAAQVSASTIQGTTSAVICLAPSPMMARTSPLPVDTSDAAACSASPMSPRPACGAGRVSSVAHDLHTLARDEPEAEGRVRCEVRRRLRANKGEGRWDGHIARLARATEPGDHACASIEHARVARYSDDDT